MEQIIIFSFSKKGHALAERIQLEYPHARLIRDFKQKRLVEQVEEVFLQYHTLIFIGAAGIAVRGIAPFIKGKDQDPAVLVVDELGQFVIPLLSGHLGGANEYGETLARVLEATPVVTTATDINRVFAVDMWAKQNKLFIQNIDHIKYISAAVLAGERIGIISEIPLELEAGNTQDKRLHEVSEYREYKQNMSKSEAPQSGILIAESYQEVFNHTLWLTPKKYILGVGCRKGMDAQVFEQQLLEFLESHNISIHLIGCMASIDLKAEELAIVAFARKYGIEFRTFAAEELADVKGTFSKSDFVQSVTGVDNVCERSAKLVSGAEELSIKKTISQGMTMAVCEICYDHRICKGKE